MIGTIAFGVFGLAVLLSIALAFSDNRRAIDWRMVLSGVGLAYGAQQVAAVPREATDQALDLVLTESGVVTPQAGPAPEVR